MEQQFIDACKNGNIDSTKDLLSKGVDPSDNNNYAIRCSSYNGHLEVVKLLLTDPGVNPSARNNEAIRWASHNGHLEVVKLLLTDKRVDPSDRDNLAIRWASQKGHIEVVKLLLTDKRVDPSDRDNLAIRLASYNEHYEVVKLLKSTIIIRTFHKLNKIICVERIKKFLLKCIVLRPESMYIKRLVNSF
jgi:ankyrin repeat protein